MIPRSAGDSLQCRVIPHSVGDSLQCREMSRSDRGYGHQSGECRQSRQKGRLLSGDTFALDYKKFFVSLGTKRSFVILSLPKYLKQANKKCTNLQSRNLRAKRNECECLAHNICAAKTSLALQGYIICALAKILGSQKRISQKTFLGEEKQTKQHSKDLLANSFCCAV